MIRFLLLLSAAPLAFTAPAAAQTMGPMPGMNMPGMHHPPARARPAPRPQAARPAPRAATATRRAATPATRRRARPVHRPHAAAPPAHDMSSMPGMQMPPANAPAGQPAHDISSMPGMQMPAANVPAGQPAHDMSSMPGMQMPPANAPAGQPAHDMSSMPGMQMPPANAPAGQAGHDMSSMPGMQTGNMSGGTADPPATPPSPVALSGPAHAADTVFPVDEMAGARDVFRNEHGSIRSHLVLVDLLEARIQSGRDGYAWDGEGWYGGAIDRLWLKTQGEGTFGRRPEHAEAQALWSHAIDPWFNLQAGVRYDFLPDPRRGYLVLGVEGLAPYWFEIDSAVFLSNKGEVSGRLQAQYDQRITQRLILQPRVDLDVSLQDVPEIRIGSGISSAEAGLRLRYEIVPEFAPYVGVHYGRSFGDTSRFRRAAGEDVGGWTFLMGVRTWF